MDWSGRWDVIDWRMYRLFHGMGNSVLSLSAHCQRPIEWGCRVIHEKATPGGTTTPGHCTFICLVPLGDGWVCT